MPLTKVQEWILFVVAAVILIAVAVVGGLAIDKHLQEQQVEFEETNENSAYVGHFNSGSELRRVDDLDRGVSCYKVEYDRGITCVYTGNFTQE